GEDYLTDHAQDREPSANVPETTPSSTASILTPTNGVAHYQPEPLQCRIIDVKVFENCLKRAPLAAVVELDLRNFGCIERSRVHCAGGSEQFTFGNEDELRFRINEPLYQPGTGNAVHFDVAAWNPFHDQPPS